MSDSLIIDNVVTFLMVGQETTAQALSWALYCSPCFRSGRTKIREEVRRVIGNGPLGARPARTACRVRGGVSWKRCDSIRRRQASCESQEAGQAWRGRARARGHRQHSDLCRPPPPAALAGPASLRSLPVWRRSARRASPLRLYAVQHRPKELHWRGLLHDRVKTMLATLLARARFELPEGEVPVPLARITLRPSRRSSSK